MTVEIINASDAVASGLSMKSLTGDALHAEGVYTAECRDAEGNLKWVETFDNLVTTVGKNDILDKYLSGSAYTASVYMGLKGTGTAAAGDTMSSHAGWDEVGGTNAPAYSGSRPAPSFAAASAGSKATSTAVQFTFTSSGTVAGCFIVMGGSATKDTTTGVLLSVGDFAASRSVVATDVLNVTYTLSV